jgi:hypothetical protein
MRLPGTPHECGPLLELGWISRQLDVGMPIDEGVDTIPVACIVGSVQRARDFDACWHPLHPPLEKVIADIARAAPPGLEEPIDVVRVDRAYFVRDGHKRVSLARRTDREFIDARVSRAPSPYALEAQVDEEAVLRTARESEFRRHSGLAETLPDVRFALTEIDGYGELYAAIRIHAFDMSEEQNRIVPWTEVASDWYASDYRPTVEDARGSIGQLIDSMTDADIFLTIHRRRQAWWGSECDAVECAAQELLVEQQMAAARKGTLRRLVLGSPGERASRAPILPLADEAR